MESESNNQMDRLLRRHGRTGDRVPFPTNGDGTASVHLDADELNAFASNEIPAVARTRYLNHLADCGHCRRQVAELASAVNPSLASAAGAPLAAPANTIWQRIAGWIKPPTLRYAGPVMAVLCVAVIMGVVLRSQYGNRILNEQQPVKLPSNAPSGTGGGPSVPDGAPAPNTSGPAEAPGNVPPPATDASGSAGTPAPPPVNPGGAPTDAPRDTDETVARSGEESKTGDRMSDKPPLSLPPVILGGNLGPRKDADPAKNAPRVTQEQRDSGGTIDQTQQVPDTRTESQVARPKSAPPPPTGGVAANNDERQSPILAKKRTAGGNVANTQASNRAPEPSNQRSDREGDRRREDNNVAVDGSDRSQAGGSGRGAPNATVAITRTVAGRTFRRQGNLWVDSGYAEGYGVTYVTRGTEQYRALIADEPQLGTIANQLGGDILVVWKGRAYRIR